MSFPVNAKLGWSRMRLAWPVVLVCLVFAACRAKAPPTKETLTLTTPRGPGSALPVGSVVPISAAVLARFYALDGPLRSAYRRLFVEGAKGESRFESLTPIVAKAPDHPLAASYMASALMSDGRRDEALRHLLRASSRIAAPTCRSRETRELWRTFRAKGCTGTAPEGASDANAVWACPPALPGSPGWQTAVEALDYNLASVAIGALSGYGSTTDDTCP
jgi:hypothetical protein